LDNPSLRSIIDLLGTNQTSDFKLRKDTVLRWHPLTLGTSPSTSPSKVKLQTI